VVIVAAILAKHGLSGLFMVTMMAGVILLFLGFTAIARTATNIRSGARTPVAGMIHSLVLLGVVSVTGSVGAVLSPWRRSRQCFSWWP
jgi:MFS superfamily sulfate permease-like transporter